MYIYSGLVLRDISTPHVLKRKTKIPKRKGVVNSNS